MRKTIVFILVALFVCGGLMLVGCKKKEMPTAETAPTVAPTADTGATEPPGTAVPPGTGGTGSTAEKPTAEKAPEGK